MNWYYAKNGHQNGPVPTEDMIDRIAMGEIAPTDLAWCEGMADWLPVSQIPQLQVAPPARAEAPASAPAAMDQPSPYQSPAAAAPAASPSYAVPGQPPSQGLAIGAMVCGILAFIGCCAWYLAGPVAVVGVVLGHIAISKIKANPVAYGGRGMARAGLVLGYLALIGATIFAVVFIRLATMSPQEQQDFIMKWVPEEQRQEVQDKLREQSEKQQP